MAEGDSGFSLTELMLVVGIALILVAISIPPVQSVLNDYRAIGDARSIANELALARMSAASDFTHTQVSLSLTANTYQLNVWNKTANAYQLMGAVQSLSQGMTFGFGSITTPAGGQTTIAQTSPITFNSRGISVDGSGNPIGTAVIYLTNNTGLFCAVTVSINGSVAVVEYRNSAWKAL